MNNSLEEDYEFLEFERTFHRINNRREAIFKAAAAVEEIRLAEIQKQQDVEWYTDFLSREIHFDDEYGSKIEPWHKDYL